MYNRLEMEQTQTDTINPFPLVQKSQKSLLFPFKRNVNCFYFAEKVEIKFKNNLNGYFFVKKSVKSKFILSWKKMLQIDFDQKSILIVKEGVGVKQYQN